MRIMLIGDDGTVLDSSEDITREEWDNMSPMGAFLWLQELSTGDQPPEREVVRSPKQKRS